MTLAVSRRSLTARVWLPSQASTCRICGEESGSRTGFYPSTWVLNSTKAPHPFVYHRRHINKLADTIAQWHARKVLAVVKPVTKWRKQISIVWVIFPQFGPLLATLGSCSFPPPNNRRISIKWNDSWILLWFTEKLLHSFRVYILSFVNKCDKIKLKLSKHKQQQKTTHKML
jgi:hypothetical protein